MSLLEFAATGGERVAFGFRHGAHLGVGPGVGDQGFRIGDLLHRGAIGLHGVDHRVELGEFARDPDVVLGVQLAQQLRLEGGVVRQQNVKFGLGKNRHWRVSNLRAHSVNVDTAFATECASTMIACRQRDR